MKNREDGGDGESERDEKVVILVLFYLHTSLSATPLRTYFTIHR